ncbi:MAG: YqgE/AlgH family protein [Methylococcaceae bacterium]|nr:YqgE/AlgH family protein [Methylococcaceae bacterium]
MSKANYLNNQFIIAMPTLNDPNFFHTVTYLCQHNAEGALGIVINRTSDIKLGEIFRQMDIHVTSSGTTEKLVFAGGPVQQDRGFVIHTSGNQWDATMSISDSISLTTSRDIMEAIAAGEGPERYLVALGYAGWGEGQLEKEMLDNAWLNTPFGDNVLFDVPVNQRWSAAASQIGIDINKLTMPAGHG